MSKLKSIMMLSAMVLMGYGGAMEFYPPNLKKNDSPSRPDFRTSNPKKKSRKSHFKRNNKKRGK